MSHTGKDPFDAQLQAMFAEASRADEVDYADDAERFAQQVIARLDKPQKARFLAIGGAGATGSAVAGTQLESLLNIPMTEMGGVMGQALGWAGPEAIATLLMAVVVGAVGYFIPKQLQTA